ncbi:LOW QUALITY PROTEIN: actin-like protein 10 [Alca torda]
MNSRSSLDWDGTENLKALPEEQTVLVANSPSWPSSNRKKLADMLFESFRVPALHMANVGLLSLCAYGRVTGMAVELGANMFHVTSVCLAQTCREATYCLRVAGGFLSSYLHSLLMDSPNDPSVLKTVKKMTAMHLKNQCCYVFVNYEGDLHNQGYHHPARFQIPDGHWITLGKEQFCGPEMLFQPKLLHQSSPGLHHLALQSLQMVPDQVRRDTVGNSVLSGSSSVFPHFPKRTFLELSTLFHGTGCQIQVLVSVGGGLNGSVVTSFQHAWMAKCEYQEHGAEYGHEIFQQADDNHASKPSHWRGTAPAASFEVDLQWWWRPRASSCTAAGVQS